MLIVEVDVADKAELAVRCTDRVTFELFHVM